MIKIIINGCFGRMGKVLTEAIKKQDDMLISAGIDISIPADHPDFPVFTSLEACTVEADVVIDFSNPNSLIELLPAAASKKNCSSYCNNRTAAEASGSYKEL